MAVCSQVTKKSQQNMSVFEDVYFLTTGVACVLGCGCEGRSWSRLQQERQRTQRYEKQGTAPSSLLICLQQVKQSLKKTTADFSSLFIATPRTKGAQHTYCVTVKPTYIHGKIEITRSKSGSKGHPSYLGQLVSKERAGMKFWGDFKTCWNHPECNCFFPIIKPDEDPQSICEQWSKKSNEEQAKHCQILKGGEGSTFNTQ